MGVVMKAAQARLAGKRVDGKRLSEMVRARLGQAPALAPPSGPRRIPECYILAKMEHLTETR